jgi:hypothetical protein
MKPGAGTVIAILVTSLAAWAGFYALTPDAPLTAAETLVVVGACAGAVLTVRWVWNRVRGVRASDAPRA